MKISDDIFWVGALNPTLRRFDVIMTTEYGTTYNSYLVRDEKNAIIDACHYKLTDKFIERLRHHIDPEKIDYIICNHTEPDHTGAMSKLLDICPNAEVISTKIGAKWLREMTNRDFKSRTIEDGEEISLGRNTLRFMTVPFWHWPDTMFTYIPEQRVLFSCDGFGAHFCDERMFDDLIETDIYVGQRLDYYDLIMRPFADKIYEGVQRVKNLEIDIICPSHGPIIRDDPWAVINEYERLSDSQRQVHNKIAIFYASSYGNTQKMALAIAEGVESHLDVDVLDACCTDLATIRLALESSKGFILGSCTINGDALEPIWAVTALFALVNKRGKVGAAFGSYGWSGEAVGMIEERLKGLRIKVIESGLRFNFAPTEEDLDKCRAFGEEFTKSLIS